MPTDWDEEMDGEWEAAKIDNPKCQEAPGMCCHISILEADYNFVNE